MWRAHLAASRLILTADGKYEHAFGACLGGVESKGTWKLEGRRLLLLRESSRQDGKGNWEEDERTEEVWVVPWGERVLLIDSSYMNQFVEDVNTNCDHGGSGRPYYSREGSETTPVSGDPELPAPWRDRLRSREIRGRVIEVFASGRLRVDIGSESGVKEGMLLFAGGGSKAYPVNLRVISVHPGDSTLEVTCNDQNLKVEVGSAISSHAYEYDAEGNKIDR